MPKQQEINKNYVILGQYNRNVFKYVTLLYIVGKKFEKTTIS